MTRRDVTSAMHEAPTPNLDVPIGTGPLPAHAPPKELDLACEQGGLAAVPAAQAIDSQQLLRGQKVLHIHHEGAFYQLRTTKSGKLILTK